MFGAGTDYCLLLVARYMRGAPPHEDKHDAIRTAIPRAAPAIIASARHGDAARCSCSSSPSSPRPGPSARSTPSASSSSCCASHHAAAGASSRSSADGASGRASGPLFDPAQAPGRGARGHRLALGAPRPARHPPPLGDDRRGHRGLPDRRARASRSTAATRPCSARSATPPRARDGFDTLKAAFPEGALGPATVVIDRQGGRSRTPTSPRSQAALRKVAGVGAITPPTGKSTDGKAALLQRRCSRTTRYGNPALDRTDTMRDALAGARRRG